MDADYKTDLLAIEQALIDFQRKHGRVATEDLEILYATESVLERENLAVPEGSTRWTLLEALAEQMWEPSEYVDEHYVREMYDEVTTALVDCGIAAQSEDEE